MIDINNSEVKQEVTLFNETQMKELLGEKGFRQVARYAETIQNMVKDMIKEVGKEEKYGGTSEKRKKITEINKQVEDFNNELKILTPSENLQEEIRGKLEKIWMFAFAPQGSKN